MSMGVRFSVATLLIGWALAMSAAQAVTLDDNVVFSAAADQSSIPDNIDLSPWSVSGAPGDNLVIQYFEVAYRISEDTIERTMTRVYKYASEEAVRDYGNLRTYYNGASDSVEIMQALVIDSRGIAHPVVPETIQLLPDETFDVFSDGRYALLPLTGLDVGARAVLVDRITTDRSEKIAPWGSILTTRYGVPTERLRVRVEWDNDSLAPAWRVDGGNLDCEEGDRYVDCQAEDMPAHETDNDVYYDDIAPRFQVAEQRDWEDIRSWYSGLFSSSQSSTSDVAEMAAALTDGLDDETEVLKAIHEFVATEVRYVGLEHGDFAYVPRPSQVTLQRRFGDCKDKTALLIDLLKQVDIQMSPVLVATGRRDTERLVLPSGMYFDHLLVCGALSNGREYCLDSTDPYSGIDSLSDWTQGAVALPIAGTGGPVTLPSEEYQWSLNEDLQLTITAEGHLKERSEVEYLGIYGAAIRGRLTGLSSDDLQSWALDDYHATVSESVEPTFTFSGISNINAPLTIGWDTQYDEMVDIESALEYVESSAWLRQLAATLVSENEEFHYRFPGLRFSGVTRINVARRWTIDHGSPDIDMESAFGTMQRTSRIEGQQLIVETTIEAPAAIIKPADVPRLGRFLEILGTESHIRVVGELR